MRRFGNRSLILVPAVTLAASLETWLTWKIINHPAGGNATPDSSELIKMTIAGSVPLGSILVLVYLASSKSQGSCEWINWALWACIVGPLAAFIALRQYGHSSPSLLMLGLITQIALVLVAAKRIPRNTSH